MRLLHEICIKKFSKAQNTCNIPFDAGDSLSYSVLSMEQISRHLQMYQLRACLGQQSQELQVTWTHAYEILISSFITGALYIILCLLNVRSSANTCIEQSHYVDAAEQQRALHQQSHSRVHRCSIISSKTSAQMQDSRSEMLLSSR